MVTKQKTEHKKTEEKILKENKKIERIGLFNLKAPKGARRKKKYLGRGPSSGHGKTSTRGSKGQTSRSGRDFYLGFEGGQSPLIRKIPKRGFAGPGKKEYQIVSLQKIKQLKELIIDPDLLEKEGLIKNSKKPVKVLGNVKLDTALTVKASSFSRQAQEQIKRAGGSIEIINC